MPPLVFAVRQISESSVNDQLTLLTANNLTQIKGRRSRVISDG